ncbi:TRAP transporter small permease [Pusillimonas noertemannii]|uniref:TRAP transporter small permease protein n=1 Tax=Pusillimonas noertemannii TaxID=305977 RepID=A0A2U1CIU5_9BURK|nr:TRAP transporter small permease [Pusillimonas noertemannii]NYT69978.1 TRAP transporter small permease [Pusillimonas noertemannii]PVY60929.1 TRAP-type C4-dicarboxylate transport system permease small subunit [Pusillimonas noertemannii]TFL08411.1 TRAP transporter small permease [Pusillimonas noertemannii]
MKAPGSHGGPCQRGLRCCLRVLTLIAGVALALMMFVTVADVVLRNFFHVSILGTYDIVETMMVFVVFLGIGEAFLDDTHITVDVVDHFATPRTVLVLKGLAMAAAAVFLMLLLRYMPIPALEAYIYGDRKPDLPIPLIVLWIPCLLGMAAALAAVLYKLLSMLLRNRLQGGAAPAIQHEGERS